MHGPMNVRHQKLLFVASLVFFSFWDDTLGYLNVVF